MLMAVGLLSACAWQPQKAGQKAGPQKPATVTRPAGPSRPQESSAARVPVTTDGVSEAARSTSRPGSSARTTEPPRPLPGAACRSRLAPDRLLVNKQNPLAHGDFPDDLVEVRIPFIAGQSATRRYLRPLAAQAAERLFAMAQLAGLSLQAVSAFRSYEVQDQVFHRAALKYGSAAQANRDTALAGQSEHQTGLALDLTNLRGKQVLDDAFGDSPEGLWLQHNAARFGFILRYPAGKESITGYRHEPWHWRYVGRQAAEAMQGTGLSLEEYLQETGVAIRQVRCP